MACASRDSPHVIRESFLVQLGFDVKCLLSVLVRLVLRVENRRIDTPVPDKIHMRTGLVWFLLGRLHTPPEVKQILNLRLSTRNTRELFGSVWF